MKTNIITSQAEEIHTSLIKVLWLKFVGFVAETPLGTIARFVGLSFLAGLLSSILTAPDATQDAFYHVMLWRNGVIMAIVLSFAAVFYAPRVCRFLFDELCQFIESITGVSVESGETIEGVPVPELIDHLFEEGSFKREDIEGKFGMPRNRYQRLAVKMEALDILIRGENNSRVLNPEMSRGEVIEHLKGKRVAMELEYPLKIVRPLPSSAPTFVRRELAQTA